MVQNNTKGQPPSHAMKIVTGAITADEATRNARLLGPDAEVAGSGPVTNSGSGLRGGWCGSLGGQAAEPALAAAVFLDRRFPRRAGESPPIDRPAHPIGVSPLPTHGN